MRLSARLPRLPTARAGSAERRAERSQHGVAERQAWAGFTGDGRIRIDVLCAESVREGRPREQGQKGWRIDLSSREKDRQEHEEEGKKQQGEEKRG
jgi:hypothetical protein